MLLSAANTQAQSVLLFDHITTADGLSQSVAKVIFKDSYGYMWFGTYHGVNRYDGQNIYSYVHEMNNPDTKGLTSINTILEDSNKNIWIGSDNGITKYNVKTGIFKYYTDSVIVQKVIALFIDSEKKIWIVTPNGLNYIEPNTEELISFPLNQPNVKGFPPIQSACIYGTDTLLLTAGNHLIQFYSRQLRFNYTQIKMNDQQVVSSIVLASKEIWLATYSDGIIRVKNNEIIGRFHENDGNSFLPHNQIRTLYLAPNQQIWAGTQQGLALYIPEKQSFKTYTSSNLDRNSLLSPYIRSVYLDDKGTLWVGTIGGVNRHLKNRQYFKHFQTTEIQTKPKNINSQSTSDLVWDIEIDSDSIIWVATMNNGIKYIPKKELGKADFATITAPQYGLSGNTCNQIVEIKKGILYFATEFGIQKFDKSTKKFTNIPLSNKDNSIKCYSIAFDKTNHLVWVASSKGTYAINVDTEQAVYCYDTRFSNEKYTPSVLTVNYLDKDGFLWIGRENGFSVLNTKLVNRSNLNNVNAYESAILIKEIENQNILSVTEDKYGNIYLATNYGMGFYNKNTGKFNFITLPKEYSKLSYFELIADKKNNIWCGTNAGILKMNLSDSTFILYTAADGLYTNEFNQISSFVDKDGTIYMGGINGFNAFHPDSIPSPNSDIRIIFTAFYLFGKEVTINTPYDNNTILDSLIDFTSSIELKYNQNFFSIAFNSIRIHPSDKITYAYKLENFDADWRYTSTQPQATYTNVSPGTYILRVKSTNAEKRWLDNEKQLIIHISPPFWNTWPFKIAYIISIFLLGFLFIRSRLRKLKAEKQVLESEIRRRTIDIYKAKKELEKSSAFVTAVIQNAGIGLVVTDETGKFQLVNGAMQTILGYSENELLNMTMQQITPAEWLAQDETKHKEVIEKYFTLHEKQLWRKNGEKIWVNVSASLLNYEGKISIISQISNINDQKQNELEILRYRNHLEELVKQRTQALLDAKEKAERADRLKSSFLANLSHELRTPMNAINGFVQLIKDKTWSQEEHEDFLQHIVDSTFNLLSLIEDIVMLSKLDSNSVIVHKNIIEITDLLHGLHQRITSQSNITIPFNLNINAEIERPTYIETDAKLLTKIIEELAQNAIKFTQEGLIEIGLEYEQNSDNLIIYVKDTGIGISAEQLKVLFSNFGKYNLVNQQIYRGIGIGLNIVKRISNLLNLDIKVISDQGKGTKFWFSIPKYSVPMQTQLIERTDQTSAAVKLKNDSPFVLIVEDEELNYIFLREILLKLNCRILWAKDGLEAINIYKENPEIDLIFMDIKLPVLDGIEATIAIKQFSKVPIIAQTAYALANEKNKIIEAGCDDFVTKPIMMTELNSILRKYNIVN